MIQNSKIKRYQKTIEQENKDLLLTLLIALEDSPVVSTYQKEAEKEIAWRNKITISKMMKN